MHSSFVNDLLFDMQPECTLVQLPPDHPMFILPDGSNERNYKAEWYSFLKKGKNSEFFVNPYPKFTGETVLTQQRMKRFMVNCIEPEGEEFQVTPKVIYSPAEMKYF